MGSAACEPDGRSHFRRLLFRRETPFFYAFDLLALDGEDLRTLPQLERKRRLFGVIRSKGCEGWLPEPFISTKAERVMRRTSLADRRTLPLLDRKGRGLDPLGGHLCKGEYDVQTDGRPTT